MILSMTSTGDPARNGESDPNGPTPGSPRSQKNLPTIGALIIRIGFQKKGSLKGSYKGSIVGFSSIGALIIRIGIWGTLCYNHKKEPRK